MKNERIWDWKNSRSISQEDLATTIRDVERNHDTLQTAIKDCKRSQIADFVINIDYEKVKLNRMKDELTYLKALSHEETVCI